MRREEGELMLCGNSYLQGWWGGRGGHCSRAELVLRAGVQSGPGWEQARVIVGAKVRVGVGVMVRMRVRS